MQRRVRCKNYKPQSKNVQLQPHAQSWAKEFSQYYFEIAFSVENMDLTPSEKFFLLCLLNSLSS